MPVSGSFTLGQPDVEVAFGVQTVDVQFGATAVQDCVTAGFVEVQFASATTLPLPSLHTTVRDCEPPLATPHIPELTQVPQVETFQL